MLKTFKFYKNKNFIFRDNRPKQLNRETINLKLIEYFSKEKNCLKIV